MFSKISKISQVYDSLRGRYIDRSIEGGLGEEKRRASYIERVSGREGYERDSIVCLCQLKQFLLFIKLFVFTSISSVNFFNLLQLFVINDINYIKIIMMSSLNVFLPRRGKGACVL